jgi:hypothetical protein
VWQPTRSTSDIRERDQTFVPPADIRQFLQPALDVDGRQVRGSKNELNCHNIVGS